MTPQELCKTDPFYLSGVLGYDFHHQEMGHLHKALFETLLQFTPGVDFRDLSPVKNRLILWPRGHYKTTAMVLHIVQLILNFPDVRILLMQGNLKLARGWLAEVKSHFDRRNTKSLLPKLFPEFCPPEGGKLGNASEFTVPARRRAHLKEATVTVASPKAISTGQHYDAFFADDLVNSSNHRNIELLDKLDAEFSLFAPLIDPGGFTTVTGTRYHHSDIYGRIIRRNQGEWAVSIKGASLTGAWPINDDNELLFPARIVGDPPRKIGFTKQILEQLARDNPEVFWAQYFNKIVAAGRQLFPRETLLTSVRSTKDPEYPANAPCVMTIDLAESQRADSDHSVLTVGRTDGRGRIYVQECLGAVWSPSALATVIMQQALKHRPIRVLIEDAAGAKYFSEYLAVVAREKGIVLPVELLKSTRQKDAKYIRIAALESAFRNGRLFLCAGIADFERLVEEFEQFPKGQHDDRPDCISLLVQWFSQQTPFRPTLPGAKLSWIVTAPGNPITEDPAAPRPNPLGDGWTC